jgi:hypothetical protein
MIKEWLRLTVIVACICFPGQASTPAKVFLWHKTDECEANKIFYRIHTAWRFVTDHVASQDDYSIEIRNRMFRIRLCSPFNFISEHAQGIRFEITRLLQVVWRRNLPGMVAMRGSV